MSNYTINNNQIKILIIAIQLALVSVVILDYINIHIPLLRELVSILYLTFIPGILILKILKIDKLNFIEAVLYSVGLSISLLYFLGLFINFVYPFLGIKKPFSLEILLISLLLFSFLLYLAGFSNKKDFNVELNVTKPKQTILLALLPLLAIIGTYAMNYYSNNIILLLLILLLSFIPILISFNKIHEDLYPFSLFVAAISLLYFTSFISSNLWGWDIQAEFYYANLTIQNSFWTADLNTVVNNVISITLLAPIYSIISNMDIKWIFKIVYPFILSLVPVALYKVFNKITSKKNAFLASFFFISFFVFYVELIQIAKEQIAELFFALLMLLFFSRNKYIDEQKVALLVLIFSFSIIVSHYSTSYIFMGLLLISSIIIYIFTKIKKITGLSMAFEYKKNYNYVFFFVIICLVWYMSFPGYNAFAHVVLIGNQIYSNLLELANTSSAQGMATITSNTEFTRTLVKYINLLAEFFITIGLFKVILQFFKGNKAKFNLNYLTLSFAAFIIAISGLIVPYFGSAMNVSRLYQLTLFFLAPFCIIGCLYLLYILRNFLSSLIKRNIPKFEIKGVALFIMISLLLNTGFVTAFTNEQPYSNSLGHYDNPIFNDMEYNGAVWITTYNLNKTVYADEYRMLLLNDFDQTNIVDIQSSPQTNSYIYFGTENVNGKLMTRLADGVTYHPKYIDSQPVVQNRSEIFDNGGSQIYL